MGALQGRPARSCINFEFELVIELDASPQLKKGAIFAKNQPLIVSGVFVQTVVVMGSGVASPLFDLG